MSIDETWLRRVRDRRAVAGEEAVVINEVGQRLLERLDGLRFSPPLIVELGCRDGRLARALAVRYPRSQLLAIDSSRALLHQARRQRGWWHQRFERVVGGLPALPLAPASADLLVANLVLPGCSDAVRALLGLRRVLKPGGLLLVSTLGLDSLRQLREAWHRIGECHRVHPFTDVQRLGRALSQAGFAEPVLDSDWLQLEYSGLDPLLAELRASGGCNARSDRPRGLTTPRQLARLRQACDEQRGADGVWRVDLEVVYASAWAATSQQHGGRDGTEISIPIDRIGRLPKRG